MEQMIKELFLGFMRMHIFYHASKEGIYGVWMMEELRKHGHSVSSGIPYHVINSLEKRIMKSRKEVVDGKDRKYYRITGKGREAREKTRELSREVEE
jgi:DNA-binding PadR family transcriptional regulator